MKKISKKKLDEAIRINKKYYRTGDRDLLDALIKAEEACDGVMPHNAFEDFLTFITLLRRDFNEPYETYYKVLEAIGYEIINEQEQEKQNDR